MWARRVRASHPMQTDRFSLFRIFKNAWHAKPNIAVQRPEGRSEPFFVTVPQRCSISGIASISPCCRTHRPSSTSPVFWIKDPRRFRSGFDSLSRVWHSAGVCCEETPPAALCASRPSGTGAIRRGSHLPVVIARIHSAATQIPATFFVVRGLKVAIMMHQSSCSTHWRVPQGRHVS